MVVNVSIISCFFKCTLSFSSAINWYDSFVIPEYNVIVSHRQCYNSCQQYVCYAVSVCRKILSKSGETTKKFSRLPNGSRASHLSLSQQTFISTRGGNERKVRRISALAKFIYGSLSNTKVPKNPFVRYWGSKRSTNWNLKETHWSDSLSHGPKERDALYQVGMQNFANWPARPVRPVILFLVQHSVSPPSTCCTLAIC